MSEQYIRYYIIRSNWDIWQNLSSYTKVQADFHLEKIKIGNLRVIVHILCFRVIMLQLITNVNIYKQMRHN